MSRPTTSRRALLTSGAAALAGGATIGAVAAASAEPDPVFALIEAERLAWEAFGAAIDAEEKARDAFRESGFSRAPQVQTGVATTIVGEDGGTLPPESYEEKPIFAHTPEEIEAAYAKPGKPVVLQVGDRRVRTSTTTIDRREMALAALATDEAAIEAARAHSGLAEAERRYSEALERQEAAEAAVFAAKPTTPAGLIAMLDLFELRELDMLDGVEPYVRDLFAAVRAFASGARS